MRREFPYFDETHHFDFPPVDSATGEGIVAVGGNLSPGMLLSAYRQGLFPWYSEGEPILWWSPDPRFVLFPDDLHVSKSMQRVLRRGEFRVTFDTAFAEVIDACRTTPRPGQPGTWITEEVVGGYTKLHDLGYVHSVEAWRAGKLAGGLYGMALGTIFFGESMFSRVTNASKTALIELVKRLRPNGLTVIDCQSYTPHLESLGAINVPRSEFLELLRRGLEAETQPGSWKGRSFGMPEGRKEEPCRPESSMSE